VQICDCQGCPLFEGSAVASSHWARAIPTTRIPNRLTRLCFNKVQVAAAVIALAPQPTGFTVSDLARKMSEIAGPELEAYNSRRAAYDLSKVRGKGLVERI